ncbi:MAG TPA: DMT family transporter [Alphaproteobacteria bacterium]|nr:DMT family transporter [Alphaproteobacteria bacterium]
MTRVQADLALLFAGFIWGFAFVAQKTAIDHIGPFTFIASRFFISALFVLPLVAREKGFARLKTALAEKTNNLHTFAGLCGVFVIAGILQQLGIGNASVINSAFLTSLYVVLVPFVGVVVYRTKISPLLLFASVLSVFGVWLLSGGSFSSLAAHFGRGEVYLLLCAATYAVQVVMLGTLTKRLQLPFTISFAQYLSLAAIATVLAVCFESIHIKMIIDAWLPILYAGVASGGIAYTLQAVAQQHTPSADAAIIMGSEALFGGLGGVWLLHEHLSMLGISGCCAIMAAIMLVEMGPLWNWQRERRRKKS